jgi:glycosyltransferase involved in cell wall biosynthesis
VNAPGQDGAAGTQRAAGERGPIGLASRGIVAFAEIDWRGTWYSRHQILSRLAHTCPVVVVDHPTPARDVVTGASSDRPLVERVAPNLWRYRPPRFLPEIYRPAAARDLLETLRARHLAATVQRLGLADPVLYAWHPRYAPAVARLPGRFTVFHCYDKYDAYHGASVADVHALERELVARADLVFASSRILADDIEQRTAHAVRYLPHGVDFDAFRAGADRDPLPPELAALPRPRIGYVARLDERIDDEALREIATRRPDWSLVIIGGDGFQSAEGRARFASLTQLPNVHALGQRPRETIPALTAGLDVCLLCYRTDNWGRWVQPIKAYEYLACGRPVVSAPIDAARDFGDLVRLVPERGGWVSAIEAALAADGPEAVTQRIEFARRNTWDQRVAELVAQIEEGLTDSAARARPTAH